MARRCILEASLRGLRLAIAQLWRFVVAGGANASSLRSHSNARKKAEDVRDQLTRARTPQADRLAIAGWGGALRRGEAGGGRETQHGRHSGSRGARQRKAADPAGEAARTLVDEYGEGDDKVEDGVPPVEIQEHLQRQVRTHLVAVRHHRAFVEARWEGVLCKRRLGEIKEIEKTMEKGFAIFNQKNPPRSPVVFTKV